MKGGLAGQTATRDRAENTAVGTGTAFTDRTGVSVITVGVFVTAAGHLVEQTFIDRQITAQIGARVRIQNTIVGSGVARLCIAIGGIGK